MRRPWFAFAALLLAVAPSCKKVIGDSCTTGVDCSLQGDRVCDTTQVEGYCTIQNCDPGGCPDDAVCVAFNAQAPRLTRRFCMASCNDDSDCRDEYRCVIPTASQAMCARAGVEILPPGQSCNVRLESSKYAGWCEVRPAFTPAAAPTDAGRADVP